MFYFRFNNVKGGVIMIKKIFRYKLVSIYFILSQLIVLTAIFGVLQIYNKAYAKEQDRLNALANNRIELDMTTTQYSNIFKNSDNGIEQGNIVAEGNIATEFAQSGNKTKCEVLLAINEELPYPLVQGHIPGTDSEDIGKNVVALGRDKYKYAYEKDGNKYVTLDGEDYQVVGVIGSENSDYWDYRIVFNINCMAQNTINNIIKAQQYVVTIYSNFYNMSNSYETFSKNILKQDNMCNIVAYQKQSTGESTINTTLSRANIKTNIMVYIFCLFNCIIISMFWLIQRKKELAIKKVFGYSNVKILVEMATEISALMVVSLVLFIILYGIYELYNYLSSGTVIQWSGTSIIAVLVLFFITLIITMLYPIVEIFNKESSRLIR